MNDKELRAAFLNIKVWKRREERGFRDTIKYFKESKKRMQAKITGKEQKSKK